MIQKWIFLPIIWVLLVLQSIRVTKSKNPLMDQQSEHVCGNVDIRNNVDSFEQLENCTVVEGYVKILLLNLKDTGHQYASLSFPKLVEITDYLLLYMVSGLKSLSDILPNLTVIRGQTLLHNFALVAYKMPHLETLGLHGLTTIMRGGVYLGRNAKLCYIDTVDWTSIARGVSVHDNFFKDNQNKNHCSNSCPRDNNARDLCPVLPKANNKKQALCWNEEQTLCWERKANNKKQALCWNEKQALCWDDEHCQKMPYRCRSECEMCNSAGVCCHSECLGDCYGPRFDQCVACKHVKFQGKCLTSCPPNTLQYSQRRCMTENECREVDKWKQSRRYWKLHGKYCLPECPPGYTESKEDKHRCEECNGPCPKVCNGSVVRSVESAQKLKGCTVINGTLEILVRRGRHVEQELEANLGSIKIISNHLKIVQSDAITSLGFLKNLCVIHGDRLWDGKYSLVLVDNYNLEHIWDFDTHSQLEIKNGGVYVHHNRRLCMHIVEELIKYGAPIESIDREMMIKTNGNQGACKETRLDLEVVEVTSTSAKITWYNYMRDDPHSFTSFVVNYRSTTTRNLTIYRSGGSCEDDVWKTQDVLHDKNKAKNSLRLGYLEPWTQYAVYVSTMTSSSHSAVSKIKYFTTKPTASTRPRDIKATSGLQGELVVTWKPPVKPNGKVTHYYVFWQPLPFNRKLFERRNYCHDKLQFSNKRRAGGVSQDRIDGRSEKEKSEREQMLDAAEEEHFRLALFDAEYNIRSRPNPEKSPSEEVIQQNTDVDTSLSQYLSGINNGQTITGKMSFNFTNTSSFMLNQTGMKREHPYLVALVNETKIVLRDLSHYQEYNIQVIACQDYDMDTDSEMCSGRGIAAARTLPSVDADTIDPQNITVSNMSASEVGLHWAEPVNPNGLILTYEIEYKKMQREHIMPQVICIPHKEFSIKRGYVITGLSTGNHSFRIRATSPAGNGSWTHVRYFSLMNNKEVDSHWTQEAIIAGVVFAGFLLVVTVGGTCFFAKKQDCGDMPGKIISASVNPQYLSAGYLYTADEWEVDRDKISRCITELGQGSFGMVYEGTVTGLEGGSDITKVAIKTVNTNASLQQRMEFLNEASVMKAFNCNHVVKLLGVVSQSEPTLVIMELMEKGDLKTFLRRQHCTDENEFGEPHVLDLKRLLQMSGEIADGMAYLANKKLVHRDLAARNCMVAENLTVKIGDFGMTRDIYEMDYYRKGDKGLLPVRWMAPEALKDGTFTSMSDIWSYGIVLWEMATLAAQPYQGLANEQVLKYVIDGRLMEKPEGCPEKLYDLMILCWKYNPKQRPTFPEIIEILLPDLDASFQEVSFFFSGDTNPDLIHGEENDEDVDVTMSPTFSLLANGQNGHDH